MAASTARPTANEGSRLGAPRPGEALHLPDLTLPQTDTGTLRRLLGRELQRRLACLGQLPLQRVAEADRPAFVAAVAGLRALQASAPSKAAALVRAPTLSVLIELCWRRREALGSDDALLSAFQAHVRELSWLLLCELATAGFAPRDGRQQPLRLALPPGGLPPLLILGAGIELRIGKGAAAVQLEEGALRISGPSGERNVSLVGGEGEAGVGTSDDALCVLRRPWHVIRPGLLLAEADNSPLSMVEAHPDKDGNQLQLGGHPTTEWVATLGECVDLIHRYLPLIAEELRLLLRLCIPVGFDAEKHLSASFQEYIGAIYLTLHPNAMTMAEALIHEFQHNKINTAFHFDPLLRNAFWPLVSSPVRPDPRPLHGVVLAVHAFQPVARLYQRMHEDGHPWAANPSWQQRAATVFAKIHEGACTVLEMAEPTPAGVALLDEMRQLDGELMAFARSVGWSGDDAAFATQGDEP